MSLEVKTVERKGDVIAENIIKRALSMQESGLSFPNDYNLANAITASRLKLNEVVDKNKLPAIEVCTPNSINTAFFEMITRGLDVSKAQGYFIVNGDKLTFTESYFGTITRAKRASKNYKPIANIIYKGDVFEYAIEPETGLTKIIKHEQKLESIDSDIIGAYAYITDNDGKTNVLIMTKKQIDMSWSKSRSYENKVHKEFPDEMVKRTIIKRACKILINTAFGDDDNGIVSDLHASNNTDEIETTDFDDLTSPTREPTTQEPTTQETQVQVNEQPLEPGY